MLAGGAWAQPPLDWVVGGVGAVLKATVLLAGAWGAVRLLRSRSAALRHLVWTAALAGALALPALDAGLPGPIRIPAIGLRQGSGAALTSGPARPGNGGERGRSAGASAGLPTADGRAPPAVPPASTVSEVREVSDPAGEASGPGARRSRRSGGAGLLPDTGRWPVSVGWTVLIVWVLGAGFVLLRTLASAIHLGRVRRRADPLPESEWRERVRELYARLGGTSRPAVLVSPEVSVPLTCGAVRPALILPQEALDEWPRERTEAVLLHEFGHLLRRDAATHLIGRLACAVYWFHPLAWRATREAVKERERACDDLVLRVGFRASRYARELLEVARQAYPRSLTAPASASVARRADLEGRVLSILDPDADRRSTSKGSTAGVAASALILTLGLALLSVGARAADGEGATGPAGRAAAPTDTLSARGDAPRRRGDAPRRGPGAGEIVPSLLRLLDDPAPAVRAAAAEAVGEMGIEGAVPRLSETLEDPSARVRRRAAKALGEIEDPRAVDALARTVATDDDREVRETAAWALGETESPRAVTALEDVLADVEADWLRVRLVRALGETRRPSAVPVLRELMGRRDRDVRAAALEALVENATDAALATVAEALESDDAQLRALAARALGHRK